MKGIDWSSDLTATRTKDERFFSGIAEVFGAILAFLSSKVSEVPLEFVSRSYINRSTLSAIFSSVRLLLL